jgi:hypothetical protein
MIGVADVSAMNATDPQRTPNTRPCLARVNLDASLEKLMSLIRVFWWKLNMMISLSVDAPLSKAIGLRLPDPQRGWRRVRICSGRPIEFR